MKIGIKKQILIAVLAVMLIGVATNVTFFLTNNKSSFNLKQMNRSNVKKDLLNDFNLVVLRATLAYMDAIVDKASLKVADELKEEHQATKKWFDEKHDSLSLVYKELGKEDEFKKLDEDFNVFWTAGDSLLKDIENKKIDGTDKYDDDIDGKSAEIQKNIEDKVLLANKVFTESASYQEELQGFSYKLSIATLILSLIVGIGLTVYLTKSISKALDEVSGNMMSSSVQINATSTEFKNLGSEISSSMEKQASALQETVAAVEEINQMVAKNAEGAQSSVNYSDDCIVSADYGKKAISDMLRNIQQIEVNQKETTERINKNNVEIAELVGVIKNISEKTNIINDIVFQTKLLSFNASVEAARAGENGKGFAVVAEEVGNLANLSGTAAKEINEMLNEGVLKVEKIVDSSKRNVEEIVKTGQAVVSKSASSAKDCEGAIEKIVGSVEKMKEVVVSISSASKEQQIGVQEITTALLQIDKLTTGNNALAKDCASQAEQLFSQSTNLKTTVDGLKVAIEGKTI